MPIYYRAGYKYQLAADYTVATSIVGFAVSTQFIFLTPDGIITIKNGYAWDGPSGPTVDTPTFMRGSLVHDAFYQLLRDQLLPQRVRLKADKELRRMCREDGMSAIRAWWVYNGVRFGGAEAARKAQQVLTAP